MPRPATLLVIVALALINFLPAEAGSHTDFPNTRSSRLPPEVRPAARRELFPSTRSFRLQPEVRPRQKDSRQTIGEYEGLIAAYRAGEADATDRLSSWPVRDAHDAIAAIESAADPLETWETWRFECAAMLHTEVAIRLMQKPDVDAADAQLRLAQEVLRRGGEAVRPYAIGWYARTAHWLRSLEYVGMALHLLDGAPDSLQKENALLYERGLSAEQLAVGFQNQYILQKRYPAAMGRLSFTSSDSLLSARNRRREQTRAAAATQLTNAERAFRNALATKPADEMARLHLGRVLMLRDHPDEALAEVAPLTGADAGGPVAYIALMVAGAAHERSGRLAQAITAYQAAVQRFPNGQSGYIALAEAESRTGDYPAARRTLDSLLHRQPTGTEREPWWVFTSIDTLTADEVFDDLRKAARQ